MIVINNTVKNRNHMYLERLKENNENSFVNKNKYFTNKNERFINYNINCCKRFLPGFQIALGSDFHLLEHKQN